MSDETDSPYDFVLTMSGCHAQSLNKVVERLELESAGFSLKAGIDNPAASARFGILVAGDYSTALKSLHDAAAEEYEESSVIEALENGLHAQRVRSSYGVDDHELRQLLKDIDTLIGVFLGEGAQLAAKYNLDPEPFIVHRHRQGRTSLDRAQAALLRLRVAMGATNAASSDANTMTDPRVSLGEDEFFAIGRMCMQRIRSTPQAFDGAATWLRSRPDGSHAENAPKQHFGPILHRLSAAKQELVEKYRGVPEHVLDRLTDVQEARRIMLYVALVAVPYFDGACVGLGWAWELEADGYSDGRGSMKLGTDDRAGLCALAVRCLAVDEDLPAAPVPVGDPPCSAKFQPRSSRRSKRSARGHSKADRVRQLLTAEEPYQGTKTELAQKIGYTHQASLANVKNFANLWQENERKLAQQRSAQSRRMRSPKNT